MEMPSGSVKEDRKEGRLVETLFFKKIPSRWLAKSN